MGRDSVADPSCTALTVLLHGEYIYISRHNVQHQGASNVFKVGCSAGHWFLFSHGAAIAPHHYSHEYLLNLQYEPNTLPPNLEFDIPKFTSDKTKRGSRRE